MPSARKSCRRATSRIADGSQTAYDVKNPVVRIVRGAFGSFFMEIEGVSHSPKVRRVQ